jgi:hypothetical protein
MTRKFQNAYLHFGGDKTGSTAIQMAFDSSRQLLLECGAVAYPFGHWHAPLGTAFCDFPERYVFNTQQGLDDPVYLSQSANQYLEKLTKWIESAPKCESLVFSYEGFVDLDINALQKFKAYCENYAESVKVVLYVRPPFSYAVSAMSQRVKQGYPSWPLNNPPLSPYKVFIEKITQVFGKNNICVNLFSAAALKNGDVVEDFLHVLDISDDLANKVIANNTTANESLSQPALHFGDFLINAFIEHGLLLSQGEHHQKYGQYLNSIPGDGIRLSIEQKDALLIATKPHTDYLSNQFGVIFSEDISKYVRTPSDEPSSQIELIKAIAEVFAITANRERQRQSAFSVPEFLLLRVALNNPQNAHRGELLSFNIEFSLDISIENFEIQAQVLNYDGQLVLDSNITLLEGHSLRLAQGCHFIQHQMIADFPVGKYTAGYIFTERIASGSREVAHYEKLIAFEVMATKHPITSDKRELPVHLIHRQTGDTVVGLIEDASGTIACVGALGSVDAGESFMLPVQLTNTSTQSWFTTWHHPIKFSYHWLDETGNTVLQEGVRSPLPVDKVLIGQTVASSMHITAPALAGRYRLMLNPLQEEWTWFDKKGFTPCVLDVSVVAPDQAHYYPAIDIRFTSKTGQRDGSELVSSGRAGLLLHGPYAKLPAGRYMARFYGHCEADAKGGWVDACFDKGATVLTRVELGDSFKPGVIAELPFEIAQPVNDLEIRLWMPAKATVRVKSLSIEPYTAAKPPAKKPPPAEPVPPKAEPSKPKKIKK